MTDDRFALYRDASNAERASSVLDRVSPASPEEYGRDERGSLKAGLSVVILTLNRPQLICPLVDRLIGERQEFSQRGLSLEILLGDTGSTDREVLSAYEKWAEDVEVVKDLSYHFAKCNNRLASQASCDTLLFLNNDVVLDPREGCPLEVYESIRRAPDVGILGAVLFFPDGRIQHAGIDFLREPPGRGFPYHPRKSESIDRRKMLAAFDSAATTGAFLAIDHGLFRRIGGFSEAYSRECQDVDLCLQAHRIGYRTRVLNLGETIHFENATRPTGEECWPDRRLFLRRWRSYVEAHFL